MFRAASLIHLAIIQKAPVIPHNIRAKRRNNMGRCTLPNRFELDLGVLQEFPEKSGSSRIQVSSEISLDDSWVERVREEFAGVAVC